MAVRIARLKNGEELIQDSLFFPPTEPRPNPYPNDHKNFNKWASMEQCRLQMLQFKEEVTKHNEAIDKAIQPTEPELPDIKCTVEEWEQYLKEVDIYKLEMRELGIIGYQKKGAPFKPEHLKKQPRPLTRDKNIKVLEDNGFIVEGMTVSDGYGKTFKVLINGKIQLDNGRRVSVYLFMEKYKRGEL